MLLGIDPGMGGALAWVSAEGYLVDVADMPVIDVRGRNRVNAAALCSLMSLRPVDRVVIEGVGARPGNGNAGMFAFGYGAGLLEGVATGLGIAVEVIQASVWKKRAGVPADKGAARQMACRMWPGAAPKFARVRDDGRAEAALLARWAALRS